MQDRFQRLALCRVGEYTVAQELAIQQAVPIKNTGAEVCDDSAKDWSVMSGKFARDMIGIDNRYAATGE